MHGFEPVKTARLLVATTNPHKLREIRELLAGTHAELISLADLPPTAEPEETAETFQLNARIKALAYDRHRSASCGAPAITVAEDSGLVVDALGGEPGVRSARFLGPDATYASRFDEILRRLADAQPRTARFICALCAVEDGKVVFETEGRVEGEIARAPSGSAGFGYDPIFFYPPYGSTLADVTQEAKLHVAHRGQAFRALGAWLRSARP